MTPEQITKLEQWEQALKTAAQAKLAIEAEQALRKEVVALFFEAPKEGLNTLDLASGWKLKLTHKIDRKVDEAALAAVREELTAMGVNMDTLIKMKPDLETKTYRALTEINPDAAKVFEQALVIKSGSPSLDLIAPKE